MATEIEHFMRTNRATPLHINTISARTGLPRLQVNAKLHALLLQERVQQTIKNRRIYWQWRTVKQDPCLQAFMYGATNRARHGLRAEIIHQVSHEH